MPPRPTTSVMDADSYFASVVRSTEWDAATDSEKEQALTQASYLIAGAFILQDNSFAVNDDGSIVWNERIVAAVCEEAMWLLSHDPSELPDALTKGIVSASAGAVSATFDKTFVTPWICTLTRILIGDLGVFIGDEDGTNVRTTLLAM